jgi:formylglycine-generating enzyme required for sulfatase activity
MASECCSPTVATLTVASARPEAAITSTETSLTGMVQIPAGPFSMGTNNALAYPADGEGPKRIVELDEFWIDETAVTNQSFAQFVEATGYITEAELTGWSFVPAFLLSEQDEQYLVGQSGDTPWWVGVTAANWRQPLGPSSSTTDIQSHPVTHISWRDANAFAQWNGKRLPTEAQWEKAARGGLDNSLYAWGDDLIVDGQHMCNIWQGDFPTFNSAQDGHLGTAPVHSFEPNGYGLYNVCGNVWEWTADSWNSTDLADNKVIKGGSFMCHDSYCNRYRLSARTSHPKNGFTAHIGFRCVADKNRELLGSL